MPTLRLMVSSASRWEGMIRILCFVRTSAEDSRGETRAPVGGFLHHASEAPDASATQVKLTLFVNRSE